MILDKNDLENMIAGMIADFSISQLIPLDMKGGRKSDSLDQGAIMKINQILKIRRTASA